MFRSMMPFVVAGLCEIGGGYGVWLWLRGDRTIAFAMAGIMVIMYAPRT